MIKVFTKSFMLNKVLSFIILSFFFLIIFFPYFWTILASFKNAAAINRPLDFGFTPTFMNWKSVLNAEIPRQALNSLIVGGSVSIISLIVGSCAAYSFSHFKVGGNTSRFLTLLAQMLPPAVLIVPLFFILYYTKLNGSLIAAILSHLTFILPLVTWFLIGFFDDVPKELVEAAKIDGCTDWQAFIKVIIPSVRSGLGAAGLFGFVLSWNDLFYALILTGGKNKTLPVGISEYWTFRGTQMGPMSAAIILAIIPMIVLSYFVQKYMLRGLGGGAIKG